MDRRLIGGLIGKLTDINLFLLSSPLKISLNEAQSNPKISPFPFHLWQVMDSG